MSEPSIYDGYKFFEINVKDACVCVKPLKEHVHVSLEFFKHGFLSLDFSPETALLFINALTACRDALVLELYDIKKGEVH
jgi:hypothetical protein